MVLIIHHSLLVQQAGDDAALEDMLLHDLGDILRGHMAVEAALGIDYNHGAQGAQAEAAGLDDLAPRSSRPFSSSSRFKLINECLGMPEELQPVPPHTRMWDLAYAIGFCPPYSVLGARWCTRSPGCR